MDKTKLFYSNIIIFTKAQSIETKTKKNWQAGAPSRIGHDFKFYESTCITSRKKHPHSATNGTHCGKIVGGLEDWG